MDDNLPEGTVPINSPDLEAEARAADIILAVDPTGSETVFYGRSLVELIAAGVEGPKGAETRVLRVSVDPATDDLERLCAVCEAFKGQCDYQAPDA